MTYALRVPHVYSMEAESRDRCVHYLYNSGYLCELTVGLEGRVKTLALGVVWFHEQILVITATSRFVCYFTVVNLGVFYQ